MGHGKLKIISIGLLSGGLDSILAAKVIQENLLAGPEEDE